VNEFLTVAELSELVDIPSTELVGAAFKNLGLMVTINQRLDFDQIELLLEEFNFKAVREEEYSGADAGEAAAEIEDPDKLVPRAPVVTVMGHVDHGKTLLLDAIRKTNVVAGESGGITQHIGAYHVELEDDRTITFLDTPGHAAFTAMRARGADVTDLVVLVVAADDSIMPQTIEAISHARNAGVPVVVAINKMDLPGANPGKVKQELLQHEVTVEEFGGDVLVAELSAKTGEGIEDLLEKILLQAEIMELAANPDRRARGRVVEAHLDKGRGPVATVLVQSGTLRVGDVVVAGMADGKVRAMFDENGNAVETAVPSQPVLVLGWNEVPEAGDEFRAVDEERLARDPFLRMLEATWMLQQVPMAILLFWAGGLPWLVWGVPVRVAVSLTGHWLIGHITHRRGPQSWVVDGVAVQGHDLPAAAWITFGEAWHGNHHAWPESARLGIKPGQADPGWWVLRAMRRLGLAWDLKEPEHLRPLTYP
jgi:translation initiation factor IF-2